MLVRAGRDGTVHHVGPLSRGFAWIVVHLRILLVPAWIATAIAATIALPALGEGGAHAGIEPSHSKAAAVEARSARLFGVPLISRTMIVQRDPHGLTAGARQRAVRRAGRVHDPAFEGLGGVLPLVDRTTAVSYLVFAQSESLGTQDATAHAS